jgi:hypothetical protein
MDIAGSVYGPACTASSPEWGLLASSETSDARDAVERRVDTTAYLPDRERPCAWRHTNAEHAEAGRQAWC